MQSNGSGKVEVSAVTTTELGHVSGVSSAIQTQLNGKLAVASNLSDVASASTARTNLGLAIGSNVQAHNSKLDDIAGLAVTNGNFIVGDGANFVAETGSTARTSLGLGTIATQAANNVSISGGSITGLGSPSNASDAATKNYVDGLVAGLKTRIIVRAATTANIDLTQDLQNGDTLDSITLATNDKILVKNQTNQTQNGIYVVVASGTASRDTDFDTVDELAVQMIIVKDGSNNADRFHLCTTDSGTIGSANITFTQVTPSGGGTVTQIIASTGLTGGTITTTGTIAVDVGTTASKIVQLDGSARLPAVDGSQLTNLPATGATAGFAVAMAIAL